MRIKQKNKLSQECWWPKKERLWIIPQTLDIQRTTEKMSVDLQQTYHQNTQNTPKLTSGILGGGFKLFLLYQPNN